MQPGAYLAGWLGWLLTGIGFPVEIHPNPGP